MVVHVFLNCLALNVNVPRATKVSAVILEEIRCIVIQLDMWLIKSF